MSTQKKAYIATSLDRAAEHNLVRDALARLGIGCTYDWTEHGSVYAEGMARVEQVAMLEIGGVLKADVVVVLLPGGKGTHVELGAAIAADKPVVLYSQDPEVILGPKTCAFYHHPNVLIVECDKLPWFEEVAEWANDVLLNGEPFQVIE